VSDDREHHRASSVGGWKTPRRDFCMRFARSLEAADALMSLRGQRFGRNVSQPVLLTPSVLLMNDALDEREMYARTLESSSEGVKKNGPGSNADRGARRSYRRQALNGDPGASPGPTRAGEGGARTTRRALHSVLCVRRARGSEAVLHAVGEGDFEALVGTNTPFPTTGSSLQQAARENRQPRCRVLGTT
jgi:hypothetical protein